MSLGCGRGPITSLCAVELVRRDAGLAQVRALIAEVAESGRDGAAQALREAARDVVATAPNTALALLDRAVSLGLVEDAPARLVRVRALSSTGQVAAAEAQARAVLATPVTDEVEREARHELAFAYFTQNRAVDAIAEMDRVAALAPTEAVAARVSAESSFAAAVALDFPGAERRAEAAIGGSDDPATQSIARAVLSLLANFAEEGAKACRLGDEAVALAEQPGGEEAARMQPWFCAALAHMEADHFDVARRLLGTGRQVAKTAGAVWALPGYDALDAFVLLRAGELDEASAAAARVVPCIGTTDGLRVGAWAHAVLARVALHRGDPSGARAACAAGQTLLDTGDVQLGRDQIALAHARCLARENRVGDARAALADAWDLFAAFGAERPRHELAVDLVRLLADSGDRAGAGAVAGWLTAAVDRHDTPTRRLEAARAELMLEPTAARAHAVADLASTTPRRLLGATASAEAAAVLHAAGHPRASDLFRDAAGVFEELGARADLHAIAPRFGPTAPSRGKPRFGWHSLTPTERRVLDLVADGLPNAAIGDQLRMSRRTVESHVSAAYRKLSVRTRVELARAALSHRAVSG